MKKFVFLYAVGLVLPSLSFAQDAGAMASELVAEKESGALEQLRALVSMGGNTMYVLIFLSIMGLAFILERCFNLRQIKVSPKGFAAQANALWVQQKFDELIALCIRDRSTLARIVAFIVNHRENTKQEISTGAGDIASRELRRHAQRAYPLAIVATLAPLLGLLGTVLGMIESFQMVAVAGAMGDAQLLAEGISKALVTTAAGLIVAIPTLAAYHFFKTRATIMALLLEEEANELINGWMLKKGSSTHAG